MIERTKDSSKDLDEALKNLDQLTNRLKTDGLLSIDLSSGAIQTQTPSLLKKGVQLTSQFFSSVFSPKNTQLLEQRQAQIRRWVDTVKSHFDDLEAWRQGSPKERKKAAQVLTTARRYNAVLSRLQKEPQGWFNRIGQALSFGAELRDSFIPLPRRTQRRRHFTHAQGSRVSTPALSQLRQLPPKRIEPTRRELEAFRMKASTLIRQHTDVEHAADALAVVRSHPVCSVLESSSSSGEAQEAIVSLSQTLSTFPGETIKISGSFKRLGEMTLPLTTTFQLLTESRQTGFPHPSQYCAWGLGESLLPSCPLRPSDLPIASALLERKQEIAQGLLPGGSLLPRAKRWLDARRSALEQHATDFLRLNQRLALVLLGSSAEVADYFESLSHQDKALLSLSRCWQAFDTQYSERLREEMRRTFTPGIDLEEAAEIARTLHDKLLKKLEKKASKAEHGHEARFLCFVAAQLGGPIQEIFLQRASEKFRFMPPELSDRAQRLQAAAWRALESFAEDMDVLEGSDDTPSTSLQADEISYLLQRDIALFSLPLEQLQRAQGMDIVHELKAYYGRRYQGA